MQNFISSFDLLCWNIVLKGNSAKCMTTYKDGNLKIRPPVTTEEHQQVQREEKAMTILLSALPDKHMGNDGYGGYTTTLSASPGSSSSKGSLKSKSSVVDDVIYSFFANHEIDQQLVYEDLDQMNKEEFEEYDLKHQMAMLSIKVHRFEKKHGRKIKFNGRENAWFEKKLVKCFNCKKMGHFSRECRAQGGQNSNNYQKYKEARKDGSDSKAMVVVDGSIDWDKQTKEGNTDPRSLENFGMLAGIKLESDVDSEGEVVSADDIIPVVVSVSTSLVAAAVVSPHSETEFALMGLSTEAHKHAVKSLEKQIKCHQMNQLAYEEKIIVLSYELEEKSNILEYRHKLIDQATQEKQELMTKLDNEIANQAKWNNSGKDLYKLIDSFMSVRTKRGLGLDKYIREGELDIDNSKFSIFHTNSDELEGKPIYNRFASVDHMKTVPLPLTGNYMPPSNIPDIDESQMVYEKKATDSSEIKTNDDSISHSHDSVLFDFSDRSSKPSTKVFQTCDFSQECSRPNNSDHDSNDSNSSVSAPTSESSDTIVIDCARQEDFPNPNLVSAGQPNSVSADQPNPVSTNQPNSVSPDGDGILGPRPLNIQSKTLSRLALDKISYVKNKGVQDQWWIKIKELDNSLRLEKAKAKGIVDSGCSRSMSGNKDKLEDFEDFHGGEVTFRGSTGKITRKGTIKTKNLNFKNSHRVLFTENECLVLFKDFPLPDPCMVILSIPRKYNLYTFSLNDLAPKGPLTCLIAKALQNESTLWHRRLGHVNFRNINKLGIRQDYSNARTTQQNRVAKRKNQTLIEAARTMLADSLLPTIFCDSLGKFDKKSDEGYIVGYSISSKAYKVYNLVYRKIEETMNLNFLENKPFVVGTGQAWMFDIDYLTDSLKYSRVSSTNLTAGSQGTTPSNTGSQEDDSDSDDEQDVLIIQSNPTPVVPIVDEATTQNDDIKSDLAQLNADNLDELA
nr:hypothetical protein [Tanacetum cinerariifolium]